MTGIFINKQPCSAFLEQHRITHEHVLRQHFPEPTDLRRRISRGNSNATVPRLLAST